MSTAYVYIVECSDGTLYTGWTYDVERRIREHNAGRGAQYTAARGPVELVHVEEHPDRSAAQSREYRIKQWSRTRKLRLIAESDLIS